MIDSESSVAWAERADFPLLATSWSWFRTAATQCLERIGREQGLQIQVDGADLGAAFFRWCSMLEGGRVRGHAQNNPRAHASFAAGALLECLLRAVPFQAELLGGARARPRHLHALLNWPAGLVATSLALTYLDAELRFLGQPPLQPDYDSLQKHWNSLRENAVDDPESVRMFFDLFCGVRSQPGEP